MTAYVPASAFRFRRVLATDDVDWFLLSWRDDLGAGSLEVGRRVPHSADFVLLPHAAYPSRRIASMAGLRWYPELRHMGVRITPVAWSNECDQPVLHCLLCFPAVAELHSDPEWEMLIRSDPFDPELAARRQAKEVAWTAATSEHWKALKVDGWEERFERGSLVRDLHVDEIEKLPAGGVVESEAG